MRKKVEQKATGWIRATTYVNGDSSTFRLLILPNGGDPIDFTTVHSQNQVFYLLNIHSS